VSHKFVSQFVSHKEALMAVTEALIHHCSPCGTERPFEQPPCLDDHDADCPEWACVDCGGALLVSLPPIDAWYYDDLPLDDGPFESDDEAAPGGNAGDTAGNGRRTSGSPSQAA
jgi:hypothetical protein